MRLFWTNRCAAVALSTLLLATVGCKKDKTEDPLPLPDAPVISATVTPQIVEATGGDVTIACEVENPVEGKKLSATTKAEWVKDLAVAADQSTVTARLDANPDPESRTAIVTLSYEGAEDCEVSVLQAARKLPFEIHATDITYSDALIKVVPQDKEALYVSAVTFAEGFDAEAMVAENKTTFAQHAEAEGKTMEEYMAGYAKTGDQEYHPSRLSPNTAYVAYVYGVDLAGNAVTEVVTSEFTSMPVKEGTMTDCKITIETKNLTSTSVAVIFKPSDPAAYYYYEMFDKEGYEAVSQDIPGYIYEHYISQVTDYWSLEMAVKYSSGYGEKTVQSKELEPETTYYAMAVGVSLEALVNTEVAVLEITTPEDTPIDYGFSFECSEITAIGAKVTTTPNDVRAFYYWNVMTEAVYNELQGDEAKIAAYFTAEMDAQRKAQYGDYADFFPLADFITAQCSEGFDGPDSYAFGTLEPSTTYYPYAFWVDKKSGELSSATTFGTPFTTKELIISDAVAEPSLWLTDGDDWAALNPAGYLFLQGKAVLGARIAPSSSAVHWYSNIYKAADIADTDDILLGSSLINSKYNMDKTSYYLSYGVEWDNAEYVIVSIAVDAEGNRGELKRLPFKVDKSLAEKLEQLPE